MDKGSLRTSKEPDAHGIGLVQIEETVEKAGGIIQIRMQRSMFRLNICLPERSGDNDYPDRHRRGQCRGAIRPVTNT